MRAPVRIGVVGYGVGGKYFHTPFIEAAEGVELAGVVTRSASRRAHLAKDWPGVPVFDSLAALLASGVDAVTITTPPQTRSALVLEAVAAGVHVVADKPFAPTAVEARRLVRAADDAGVILNVFHNRRWDADIRTLAAVVADGRLGDVWRVHTRMDQDAADLLEAGPHGGLLRDLGSHVVDQMIWLSGPVRAVTAHLDWADLPQGRTDVGFVVDLQHENRARSYLESSKLNHVAQRTIRAYGALGCYRASSSDVQAQALFAGKRPCDDLESWGYEPREYWGLLSTAAGEIQVPSKQGRYHDLYAQFGAAVRGEGPEPVPAREGVRTLEVLDAARLSAETGSSVNVAPA